MWRISNKAEAFDISPDVLTALAHVLENYEQDIELATLILTLPKTLNLQKALKRLIQMALQPQENLCWCKLQNT